jgi:arginase
LPRRAAPLSQSPIAAARSAAAIFSAMPPLHTPLDLLLVPYDSGHREARMGRGPEHLLRQGAAGTLRAGGRDVRTTYVESAHDFRTEAATHFELCAAVAERVRAARGEERLPVVLSGNCGIALGTVAGLDDEGDLAVVWLDAHGELNTPETTTSGFLDGMGLATLTGRCWRAIAAGVSGHRPLADERLLLVGTRDLDAPESALLAEGRIGVATAERVRREGVRAALAPRLDALATRARRVYLHLDPDVLDPAVARANGFAAPDGLGVGELLIAVRMVCERLVLAGVGVASYDPAYDADGAVFSAIVGVLDAATAAPPRRAD